MMRIFFLVVLMLAAPDRGAAQQGTPQQGTAQQGTVQKVSVPLSRPATGLLWADTALPRTLPLQIRTDPGQGDLFVRLIDPETGRAVLAAYQRAGAFLRVLVPPGRYEVELSRGRDGQGRDWQGEAALFGPGTLRLTLADPLRFGTEGLARKSGHLIDLRGVVGGTGGAATVRGLGLCQSYRLDPDSLAGSWARAHEPARCTTPPCFTAPRYTLRARLCDDPRGQ